MESDTFEALRLPLSKDRTCDTCKFYYGKRWCINTDVRGRADCSGFWKLCDTPAEYVECLPDYWEWKEEEDE